MREGLPVRGAAWASDAVVLPDAGGVGQRAAAFVADAVLAALPLAGEGLEPAVLFEDPFLLASPADEPLRLHDPRQLPAERLLLLEEGHCLREQALARFVGHRDPLQERALSLGIGSYALAPEPLRLRPPHRRHSRAHLGRPLGGRRQDEVGGAHRLHLDVQVDPVEQRPR